MNYLPSYSFYFPIDKYDKWLLLGLTTGIVFVSQSLSHV